MAREREEIEIDGVMYSYRQISPTKATMIFLRLVKTFGPVLGKAFSEKILSGKPAGVSKEDIKKMPIDAMIEVIADRLDEEEILVIARKLLAETAPVSNNAKTLGNTVNFDNHFDEVGGMFHMFIVIKEVLVLQYADFFEGLGTLSNADSPSPATQLPAVP